MADAVTKALQVLNEALQLDPEAVTRLVNLRVECNPGLAAHQTIQVGAYDGVRFQQQMTTRVRLAEYQILLQSTRGLFDDKIAYVSDKVARGERLSREERMAQRRKRQGPAEPLR